MIVAKPVKRRSGTSDHLSALSELLQDSRTDAARLFEQGLALLVQALRVDQALLTRVTALGHEVVWWASSHHSNTKGIFESPEKGFCPFVIAHPERTLTIRDAAADPRWRKSTGCVELGIHAYAGVALKVKDQILGTLCVQHHAAHAFSRAELALLKTMGHLIARTLESENLKQELQAALDALELSSAIVEDSALQSARSGLPNRRYLDIWLRSALFMARRRREPMALALWSQPMVAGTKGKLAMASTHLRGEDLLVELSNDQYLLLMPHTSDSGAEVLLARLRDIVGHHPTGAALWLPDGKDMTLKSALRHVAKAFTDANREQVPLVWSRG
ncbi:MAG TPA: GAF domain-containing protein [Geothrix sp.]|nr:GAF domain-containing protein [Geothrix sp.]